MAAEVIESKSGLAMLIGKRGKIHEHRSAVCMEAQRYPASLNKLSLSSTVLQPGKVYKSATKYRFSSR